MDTHHVPAIMTYGASTLTLALWGLQISDWGVIVSALAAVCSVGLQAYVAFRRTNAKGDKRDSTE